VTKEIPTFFFFFLQKEGPDAAAAAAAFHSNSFVDGRKDARHLTADATCLWRQFERNRHQTEASFVAMLLLLLLPFRLQRRLYT
jgi:hypothetical protein